MSHNFTLEYLHYRDSDHILFSFEVQVFSSGSTSFKETLRTRRKTDANSSNCVLTFMFSFCKFVIA